VVGVTIGVLELLLRLVDYLLTHKAHVLGNPKESPRNKQQTESHREKTKKN
jgi:hypothetical protein